MKKKIIGIGTTGLVGSRIVELLKNDFDFFNVGPKTGVDITNPESLVTSVSNENPEIILHLAAKTDVDSCEKDKEFGVNGESWKINVNGTKNVINAAKKLNTKIIYISTDFIFDGENCPDDGYSEKDKPNPKNWYAQTKYEGEKRIISSGLPFIIARIAYPYRSHFALKKDFVRVVKRRLENKEKVFSLTDHIFTPTFIDDIALALKKLIQKNAHGIFHVVGSTFLTPYEATKMIADTFHLDISLIQKTDRNHYFKNRAFRPFKLALKNDKIKNLGVNMSSFSEGLEDLKRQLI